MTPQVLSVRAYARHRGSSHQAVLRAIARGRLSASLTTIDGVTKIADVALADQEWAATTDLSKAPDAVKVRAATALRPAGQAEGPSTLTVPSTGQPMPGTTAVYAAYLGGDPGDVP